MPAGQFEVTFRFDHWPDLLQTAKMVRNKDIRRNSQANPFRGTCEVVLSAGILDMLPEDELRAVMDVLIPLVLARR